MKYLLLLVLFFHINAVTAQDDNCKQKVLEKTNQWALNKTPEKGTPAELAQKKKFLFGIDNMIRSNSTPKGVQCNRSFVYPQGRQNEPVIPFSYSILALPFYCNGSTLELAHETSTSLNIMINQFLETPLFDTSTDEMLSGFFELRHGIPVEIRPGIWRFKDDREPLGFGMTGTSKLWLITHDGQLPWRYVSRKEFLIKRRSNLVKMKQQEEPRMKESLRSWETERKYKEEQWKNEAGKLKSYMDNTYNPGIERTRIMFEKTTRAFDDAINKVDRELSQPASELNKNAIVRKSTKNHLDYEFADEEGPFTEVLTMPNPEYFKKGLAKTIPQLISVEIIYNHEEEIATDFSKQMQQSINLDYLRSFIGKTAPPIQQ